ncbi:MAG TPA: BREX-1 system phosphatase PglZ type A [Nitrospirota bacterium]|nr:BREX-1 system phosphatase PglZ type A [Nitrospirota bacterium]
MNIERINEKLTELFTQHRLVFWNDPEREFEEMLPSMGFDGPDGNDGINILRPEKIGQLKAKVVIEIERPGDKFLVYSPDAIPRPEDDWLLDVRLYSYQFFADSASMIVEELGLRNHSLRDHIAKRKKFFGNKQRMAQLKKIIAPGDRSEDIDRKILAVLVKADSDRFFDIVHSLFTSFPFEEGLDSIPARFVDIQKMELEDVFWGFAREAFAYQVEQPNPGHFLTCLLVSDLHNDIGPALPENVRQFVLPGNFCRDAAVCMSEWRDSIKMAASYDCLSEMVAEALGIERYLKEIPDDKVLETLRGAVTFFVVEKLCAGRVKAYVREHRDTLDKDFLISFCRERQEKHWANRRLGDEVVPRAAFWSVYEAMIAATIFIDRKNSFPHGFSYANTKDVFEAYTRDLYVFDRQYRHFSEHAGIADSKGWAVLKDLKDEMEDLYQNWFLETLAILWEEKARLDNWYIEGVTNQYDFFGKYPEHKAGDKSAAVFVIVSDALRYEAGVEVSEALNGRYRFKARIEPMLGCVPSYTALGMAAILPHTRLLISDRGDVLVDGKSCAGIEQRSEILSAKKGFAIKCDDLLRMNREDARELVRGKNIVYVYHNTIDALGDDSMTENKTFFAVHKAIDEVCDIVSFVMNQLNARYVFITADHGFIYRDKFPDETSRSEGRGMGQKAGADFNGDIFKTNKRFITGRKISGNEDVHRGNVSGTAGISSEGDMQFVVPKGISLFYFTGGARYFHGGMSLQEVVIPVITVEQVRGDEKEKTRERTVGVQVLGQEHRITTGRHRFEIIQTDAVSERIKAVTYKIGIYAGNEPVSDIQTLKFDSASQDMVDRKKEVVLTLKNMAFPVGMPYRLIFRNAGTDIEDLSIYVRIDRAFTSDF